MDLDLNPNEWKSERDRPKEPFFGKGLPGAIAFAIGVIIAGLVKHYLF